MIVKLLLLFVFISECSSLKFRKLPDEVVDNGRMVHANERSDHRECLASCINNDAIRANLAVVVKLSVQQPPRACICLQYLGLSGNLLNYALSHTHRKEGRGQSVTLVPTNLDDVVVFWPLSKVSWIQVGI